MLYFVAELESNPVRYLKTPYFDWERQLTMAQMLLEITTDACTSFGAGGYSSLGHFFQILWSQLAEFMILGISINMMELLAPIAFLLVIANPVLYSVLAWNEPGLKVRVIIERVVSVC